MWSIVKAKCIVEFLFAKYLKGDAKSVTIFLFLVGYLKRHNVSLGNITPVAIDGTPVMVSYVV